MAWTEDQNRKAGWVQRKLRLRKSDSEALDAVAAALGKNQSDTVAELCRRFLAAQKPKGR
jgi:hypothetical protein